jgi:predicted regulator of Ras-like GTPase activity (Roadblock/LC7/MglB family)
MADIAALEQILNELEQVDGVTNAVLVSRSGMHIAGKVPEGAHPETFVAMFAILLGAAETATSELRDELGSVVLNLGNSKMAIINDGPKALFVLRLKKEANLEVIAREVVVFSKKMEEYL